MSFKMTQEQLDKELLDNQPTRNFPYFNHLYLEENEEEEKYDKILLSRLQTQQISLQK